MSSRRAAPGMTKKHLARAQREQRQRMWIMGGAILTIVLMVGFIGYGLFDTYVLKPTRTLIQVNAETVSEREFQSRVRFVQLELLNQYATYAQLSQFLGEDPQSLAMLQQQLNQIKTQLYNPAFTGQRALDQLVEEILIKQEASKRGINVSPSEVDQAIAESFGYYPLGTPTPFPSPTPAPTSTSADGPQGTATPEAGTTPEPTRTPLPTPTVYTEEAYLQDRQEYFSSMEDSGIAEADFRRLVEGGLYQGRLLEAFRAEVPEEAQQALLKHILVAEKEQADEIIRRLDDGGNWEELVLEFSEDPATKETGGDLGWLTLASIRSQYGVPFQAIVLGTAPGAFAGPVNTAEGWHVVQVMSRETRPLEASEYEQALLDYFDDWLTRARTEGDIVISETWLDSVPDVNDIAPELES